MCFHGGRGVVGDVHWKEPVVGVREFGLSVDEKRDKRRDMMMLMSDAGDRVMSIEI